ncbi:MAG: glycosyltransferase family 4 protein [Deltaproteobacteria bacterium]|nr:glycosyltransferase family 4 protein [Deltaproteobacteria bacterium]
MRIAFYAPFKPLGHPHPSGDQVIATGLYDYFRKQGHPVEVASAFRARWIFWKPWRWPQLMGERRRAARRFSRNNTDLWLTYHTYYKAPDLLGPWTCHRAQLPYVIFQGIYSTKRKRNWRTRAGFILNRKALRAARHIFTNRYADLLNLKRLLPPDRLTYVAPGIYPEDFRFSARARDELRRSWNVGNDPVILSAAMFRPGVKTSGLVWVIRACSRLFQQGQRFHLVIAGDGKEKQRLLKLAQNLMPGNVRFVGKIPRNEMYRFYSGGDIFAFPGIRESLGMVYLEAQSCGIPVVAFANGGIREVVKTDETGFLVPSHAFDAFTQAINRLMTQKDLREKMGRSARSYVRSAHDLNRNYKVVENILESIIRA